MITNLVLAAILAFTRSGALQGNGDFLISNGRTMSLGGIYYQNPAYVHQNGFFLKFDIDGGIVSERWTRPAYDRFGSTVGELTEYSFQRSAILTPDFSVGYADRNKFAGISKQTIYDLSYRYERVFRSDYYTIDGFHTVKQDGNLTKIGLSFGYRFKKGIFGIDAGIDVSQYTAQKDYFEAYGHADGTIDTTKYSFKLSSMAPAAGVVLKAGYRAALGIAYRSRVVMVGDSDSVSYPAVFSATVQLTPPSKILTNVYFNYIYDGNIRYSVGFEHEIIKGEWIRFGGMISENLQTLRWEPSFGFGFGHSHKLVNIDIGVNFQPISYRKYAYGNSYTVKEWKFIPAMTLNIQF